MTDVARQLAELEAVMAGPDYQPILAGPAAIGRVFKVSTQAVTNLGARTTHTGVKRYPGGKYDANEVARWLLRRDEAQAARRSTPARHADQAAGHSPG